MLASVGIAGEDDLDASEILANCLHEARPGRF